MSQRYVKMMPVFGEDLFVRPSGFEPETCGQLSRSQAFAGVRK
jgi:hypothetical protein